MIYLKAFIAGFASALVFHQGLLWLLYTGGFSPRAPWNMAPVWLTPRRMICRTWELSI